MSTQLAIKTQPGYEGLGGAGTGSTSSMTFIDETWKTIAALLDAGIHLPMIAHSIYSFANDGGATGVIVPKYSALVPAGAVMVGSWYLVATALAGTGNISVGTSAGSSATSILGATAVSGLETTGAVAQAAITASSPILMSAQGQVEVTLSGTLTAGVFETFVMFVIPQNLG
jgi:hypothetical protein